MSLKKSSEISLEMLRNVLEMSSQNFLGMSWELSSVISS